MQLTIWIEDNSLTFEQLHALGEAIARDSSLPLSFEVTED